MLGIALLLYLFLIAVFIGGLVVIGYHLLTFRLNKTLAWTMVIISVVGGLVLLVVNLFYVSRIDWQQLLDNLSW